MQADGVADMVQVLKQRGGSLASCPRWGHGSCLLPVVSCNGRAFSLAGIRDIDRLINPPSRSVRTILRVSQIDLPTFREEGFWGAELT